MKDTSEAQADTGSSSQQDTPHGSSFHALLHQWLQQEGDESESSPETDDPETQPGQDKSDPTRTVAAPVYLPEKTREVLPFAFAIPSPQDQDSSSHNTPPYESALKVPAASVQSTPDSSALGAFAAARSTDSGQPAEDDPALQPLEQPTNIAPAAQSGELAFAARLTPKETGSDSNSAGTPTQDQPAQNSGEPASPAGVSSQAAEKPADSSSSTSSSLETGVQGGKGDAAALAAQYTGAGQFTRQDSEPSQMLQSEISQPGQTQQAPARNEAAPEPASPSARMEQWIEPPAAPASSSREITIRVPDATERGTNVRFVDRGGEIRVSVRTSDVELAQTLRSGLSDLAGRLDHSGIRAEVWRPGSEAGSSQNSSQNNQENQDAPGRKPSGSQGAEDERRNPKRPRWVEELETSIDKTTTPANP